MTMDSGRFLAVIEDVYREAGAAGASVAADQLKIEGVATGARIQRLLAQASIDIKGIEGTTLDRVTTAIGNGVAAQQSADEIAQAVRANVYGPMLSGQADMIASTEANRAFASAYLDSASAAGITQVNWVAYAGACPSCLDNESASPYDIGSTPDMPDHPNCECCWESVTE
ncbi:MAG: hypothetical protein KGH65_04915 [Candidatus Micrarchaeota archaeon]|nr:hypothetical protein [Candidatus Micrarchaeota archaeon]